MQSTRGVYKDLVKYGRLISACARLAGVELFHHFLYYDDSYRNRSWREIDIEVLGKSDNVFQSNIITGNADNKTTSEELHTYNKLSEDYHTYTLEWTPDSIAWFFDGEEVRRSTDAQVTDCQLKEMSYRFNLWISDAPSWAGQFNPSILPVYPYINWIKYSKYTPGSGPNGTNFTLSGRMILIVLIQEGGVMIGPLMGIWSILRVITL